MLEPAAAQLGALGEADQPEPRARTAAPKPSGLRSTTSMPSSGEPVSSIVSVDPGRACGRWSGPPGRSGRSSAPGRVRHLRPRRTRGSSRVTLIPDPRASSTSVDTSAYVGCGAFISSPASSRSTPSTPRRSVSASWALAWMTPALSRISSALRSSRKASAPACIEIWEIRWARTSCISRAIRSRSLLRDWAARSSCSASARSARWRRVHSSSRREPMYMPQASMRAGRDGVDADHEPPAAPALEPGCQVTKNWARGEARREPDQGDLAPASAGRDRHRGQDGRAAGDARAGAAQADHDRDGTGQRRRKPNDQRRTRAGRAPTSSTHCSSVWSSTIGSQPTALTDRQQPERARRGPTRSAGAGTRCGSGRSTAAG